MKSLQDIRRIHFIGIGGIGMSALARYFHAQGVEVSGYDKTETALTQSLSQEGIGIFYEDRAGLFPKNVDLVVYTPAVPRDHQGLRFYNDHGYTVMKRSEVLGVISRGSFNICVAGTHGKTTITTMIAHLLRHTGYGCNAFLGGISANYDTNFWSSKRNVCVIEADEYDRSFLRLSPDVAVISSMDADHLDIYQTEAALQEAFIEFSGKLKPDGVLLYKFGLSRSRELQANTRLSYSLQNTAADAFATNITMRDGFYRFDVTAGGKTIGDVVLNMGGMHNVENVVAAIAVASQLGIESDSIREAVAAFRGVRRRFEYVVKTPFLTYVDDYAHHPEELRALITGVKALFSGKKCTIIFQPHLFSRTRDFADAFAESLALADAVILLPIYPARELPIEGVSSEVILDKIKNDAATLVTKAQLVDHMNNVYLPSVNPEFGEVLITAGAGDIDTFVQPLRSAITAFKPEIKNHWKD